MKKKPYNDNLVMASIKSLYNQANHTTAADQTELKRQNSENLPIIGSLPVTLSSNTADQDSTQFDDMVLTGLLEAVPAEPTLPAQIAKPVSDDDDEQDDNPFLAIRQAVISAGQMTAPEPEEDRLSDEPASPAKQAFAGQLAELIDAEIERRLTERLNKDKTPVPAQKRATKQKQAKQASKPKKQKKSAAHSKKAKPDNPAPKKTTKARRRPKS